MSQLVSISSFSGSVVDGDWTPAIRAAMDTIKTKGGSILIDTDIELKSQLVTSDVSGWVNYVPLNFFGDGGSQISFNYAAGYGFYGNGNLISQTFRDLMFRGAGLPESATVDTSCGILNLATNAFVIDNCTFSGVQSSGFIAQAYAGVNKLIIRDSSFNGCGAVGGMVGSVDGAETISLENVEFYDYSNYRGTYFNKQGYPTTWVRCIYAGTPTTSHVPQVTLRNVRTDEGADFCYIEGYPRVIIENCAANANGAGEQACIHLKNVQNARITNFWAGYAPSGNTPSLKFENCGNVVVDGLQIQSGVTKVIQIDALTRLQLVNSPGVKVVSV